MRPHAPKEGLQESKTFSDLAQNLTNTLRNILGSWAPTTKILVFGVQLIVLAMFVGLLPSKASSEAGLQQPSVELALSHDAAIFAGNQRQIKITPTESNAAVAERQKQQHLLQLWQERAGETGISLRNIMPEQLDDAIADFLSRNSSPLVDNAADFVAAADQYNLDSRLMVGISGAESSFGVHIPPGSHNPFGLGPNLRFASFHDAIYAEAAFLDHYFAHRGITNPHAIGPSYTGTGSTTWGVAVAGFMTRI